jgi:hypothetical protein
MTPSISAKLAMRRETGLLPLACMLRTTTPFPSRSGSTPSESAIRGRVGAKSIGVFSYEKGLDANGGTVPCEVRVFPMIVKRQLDTWPEAHEREARWFESTKVLSVTKEKGLRQLIESFVQRIELLADRFLRCIEPLRPLPFPPRKIWTVLQLR